VEVSEVLNSLGLVYKKIGKYDKAESFYHRAISIVLETFGNRHYKLGILWNNLADVYRKRVKFPEALDLYEKALSVIEETLGKNHVEAAEIHHNIGLVQHQLGDYDKAIQLFDKALEIIKSNAEFGTNHYKYGMFLNNSGLAWAMKLDFTKAYNQLKQSLQILITNLGNNHIEVGDCYLNLGEVCMKLIVEKNQLEKLTEAKKYYTEANRIVALQLGPNHTKTQQIQSLLFICDNYGTW